jgi:hypothetical protein
MPNWCSNHILVTGSLGEIARFARTCIRQDQNGQPWFDFNSLIPMPAILEGTEASSLVDEALLVLGRDDLAWMPLSLEERMKRRNVPDVESLREKIGLETLGKARQSIEAFEQTGAPNWYVWANVNWGTKCNPWDFKVIREEPGVYECRFETAWSPPEPVYVKLAEMFPALCFEMSGGDDQLNFDFEATARDGAFNIQYGDPTKEGFCWSTDSDFLLDHAKAYGNDPKRFLSVALCQAIASNQCYSDDENPECAKVVVAWARGDTKEESENSCRDVIAGNHRWIKKLITEWQFTVYAPGEIQFQTDAKLDASATQSSNDDLPF